MQRVLLLVLLALSLVRCAGSEDPERGAKALKAGEYSEAFAQILPGAEQGDANAQYFLGRMYYQGLGVPKDPERALQWLHRAAEQGNVPAHRQLQSVSFTGKSLYGADNQRIGEVVDVVADRQAGVSSAVISVTGSQMGQKQIAVPFETLKAAGEGRLTFGLTGRQVAELPAYVRETGTVGEGESVPRAHSVVPVFYATDRKESDSDIPSSRFGGERASALSFGVAHVSIPRDHRLGYLESPSIWRLELRPNPKRHVILLSVSSVREEIFLSQVRTRINDSRERKALIFIHGYNVSFEDAARRTAQIAYDLNFQGAPFLYSWPSQNSWDDYPVDVTNAEWTVPHLDSFMNLVAEKSGAAEVVLIAHSMGNKPLTEVLRRMADRQGGRSKAVFHEIILTAPDIDAETFTGIAQAINSNARRVTLYASSNDLALKASRRFNGYRRAGDSSEIIVVVPGVDTIDASAVDTSLVGHSYYGDNRSVLSDIYNLIRDGHAPDNRFGLRPVVKESGRYWVFRP